MFVPERQSDARHHGEIIRQVPVILPFDLLRVAIGQVFHIKTRQAISQLQRVFIIIDVRFIENRLLPEIEGQPVRPFLDGKLNTPNGLMLENCAPGERVGKMRHKTQVRIPVELSDKRIVGLIGEEILHRAKRLLEGPHRHTFALVLRGRLKTNTSGTMDLRPTCVNANY